MSILKLYDKYIYDIYSSFKRAGKVEFNNNDLCKIFEYYTCIKLSELPGNEKYPFYLYDDIDPDFKEQHNMSYSDTGIDCCNLVDTIVQCKLRKNNLTWRECSTFFGSNIDTISTDDTELVIKWPKMIISRNAESTLSHALSQKASLFQDVLFSKEELIEYCERLYI
jgi:hypothetical protein